jgi:membrane protein DedA with SNARE-associated domain
MHIGNILRHFVDLLVAYGPLGLLTLGLLDSMGVPLPAAMDLLLLEVAMKTPNRAYLAAAVAVAGSLVGNVVLFRAARLGGRRFVDAKTPPEEQHRFRRWFRRYGLLTVFIPAVVPFVPLPLKVFVVSAGAMHTPISRFLAVILVARILRYFGEAYLGILLGQDASGFLQRNAWNIVFLLVAVSALVILLIRWHDRRRAL